VKNSLNLFLLKEFSNSVTVKVLELLSHSSLVERIFLPAVQTCFEKKEKF
jgi:hypothetical protein